MRKILSILILFIFSYSLAHAGFFGTNAPVVENQRKPEENRENTAGIKKNHRQISKKQSVVKCWQYGKILFEETNWRKGHLNKTNHQVFSGITNYGKQFSLIGMDDTFCYIRE